MELWITKLDELIERRALTKDEYETVRVVRSLLEIYNKIDAERILADCSESTLIMARKLEDLGFRLREVFILQMAAKFKGHAYGLTVAYSLHREVTLEEI